MVSTDDVWKEAKRRMQGHCVIWPYATGMHDALYCEHIRRRAVALCNMNPIPNDYKQDQYW